MRLRLLRGEATPCHTEVDGVPIAFEVEAISTAQQARLIDLASTATDAAGRARYIAAVLRMAVRELTIDGQTVDAGELADRADLSHPDTFRVLAAIVEEADKVLYPGAVEGKSEAPPEQ